MGLIDILIDENVPWRLIFKRRKLTKEMYKHLEGGLELCEKTEDWPYVVHSTHVIPLYNLIKMWHSKYWNVKSHTERIKYFKNRLDR